MQDMPLGAYLHLPSLWMDGPFPPSCLSHAHAVLAVRWESQIPMSIPLWQFWVHPGHSFGSLRRHLLISTPNVTPVSHSLPYLLLFLANVALMDESCLWYDAGYLSVLMGNGHLFKNKKSRTPLMGLVAVRSQITEKQLQFTQQRRTRHARQDPDQDPTMPYFRGRPHPPTHPA